MNRRKLFSSFFALCIILLLFFAWKGKCNLLIFKWLWIHRDTLPYLMIGVSFCARYQIVLHRLLQIWNWNSWGQTVTSKSIRCQPVTSKSTRCQRFMVMRCVDLHLRSLTQLIKIDIVGSIFMWHDSELGGIQWSSGDLLVTFNQLTYQKVLILPIASIVFRHIDVQRWIIIY